MFHLACYTTLLGTTANTDIPALTDDILSIQNTHFVPSIDLNVYAAYASSATLSRVRLNSGKMRQVVPNYIRGLNVAALPANNPNMDVRYDNPLVIRGQEELQVEATSAIAMGTERFYCLLWLGDGLVPSPRGDIYRARWTSTTAAVASTWTTISYSLETGFPSGQYVVVGGEAQATNQIAFRMIFDGQYFRPGMLAISSLANRQTMEMSQRQMGVWGSFRAISLPRIQVLNNGTDATHEGYMDVIRVAA